MLVQDDMETEDRAEIRGIILFRKILQGCRYEVEKSVRVAVHRNADRMRSITLPGLLPVCMFAVRHRPCCRDFQE